MTTNNRGGEPPNPDHRENARANAIYRLRKAADELEAAQFNLCEAGDDADLVGCLRKRCLVLAGEKP
jgi:hypothetical protein